MVRARRRRTRTIGAGAAATVLTCGGVAFALMDMRGGEGGGGSNTALPTASTPTDGEMSDAGGMTDSPTSPGEMTSISPGETPSSTPDKTPSSTPSKKDDDRETRPTPTPSDGDDEPAGEPSAPPKATPSATAKEPTQVSTACTGWAHSNRSDGYGHAAQNTHLYAGPYAKCSYVTAVNAGTKVYYHCYVTNAESNKWIYARIAGTDTEGWVFGDKSTLDSGALARC